MKDQVQRVEYFVHTAADKPGVGADLGKRLGKEGVNLIGMLAFPTPAGRTQVDLVPQDSEALVRAARKLGLALSEPKTAFFIQGTDRAGAMGEVLDRLGNAGINVHATFGVCSGGNRYGGIIWVASKDVEAAARALGATAAAHHA